MLILSCSAACWLQANGQAANEGNNGGEKNTGKVYGYIRFKDLTFHEDMQVFGAPIDLHYSSKRTPGYEPSRQVKVWYASPSDLDRLDSVKITLSFAGRTVHHHASKTDLTNQLWVYTWDGKNGEGQVVDGVIPVTVDITHTFKEQVPIETPDFGGSIDAAVQSSGANWKPPPKGTAPTPGLQLLSGRSGMPASQYYASPIGGTLTISSEVQMQTIYRESKKRTMAYMGTMPVTSLGMGGWTLTHHHVYDTQSGILYYGSGDRDKVEPVSYEGCSFADFAAPTNSFYVVARNGREAYFLDEEGRHLSTIDTFSGTTIFSFSYDGSGRLTNIVDRHSRTTRLVRTAGDLVETIVGPDGAETEITYDSNGWLEALVNPADETNRFLYTASGLLTNVCNRRGKLYTITYDAEGYATRAEDPAGGFDEVAKEYLYGRDEVTNVQAGGRTNRITMVWGSSADSEHIFVTHDGRTNRTVRSQTGSTSTRTLPDQTEVRFSFDDSVRFGDDVSTVTQRVIHTPSGLSQTQRIDYAVTLSDPDDPMSTLLGFTNTVQTGLRRTEVQFSRSDRTVLYIDSSDRTNKVVYNSEWTPSLWAPSGLTPYELFYDEEGRLERVTRSDRTTWLSYDEQGYLHALTNALGERILLRNDAIGRVTNIVRRDDEEIGISWQPSTPPIGVTPPGKPEHSLGYSDVGFLNRYSSPDVGEPTNMLLTWDTARRLTGITWPNGRSLTNEYNDKGQLRRTTWPEGSVTNAYDPMSGRLAGTYAENGTEIQFGYDGFLLTDVTVGGAFTGAIHATYNNDFDLRELSFNGDSVIFDYCTGGALTNVGAMALGWSSHHGLLEAARLGNLVMTQSYNGYGEWQERETTYATTSLYAVAHAYDDLGRITQRIETVQGDTVTWGYAYDTAGRLYEVATNGTLRSRYQYDANGNRTNTLIEGASTSAAYDDQDRLRTSGSAIYQYNAHGTLTNKIDGGATTAYDYDARGTLQSVRTGTNDINYLLDPYGRRIGKTVNGTTTRKWVYQDFLKPIAELDGDGTLISRFVYATRVNVPDYMVRSGQTYRIITDHLGSVRLVINTADGSVTQRMDYDEWGHVLNDTNPGFQPFGYAGGLYDPDSGLVRFGYRDYDAATGRWLAKDPILFGGGQANLYLYCFADPIDLVDRFGLGTTFIGLFGNLVVGGGPVIGIGIAFNGDGTIQFYGYIGGGVGFDIGAGLEVMHGDNGIMSGQSWTASGSPGGAAGQVSWDGNGNLAGGAAGPSSPGGSLTTSYGAMSPAIGINHTDANASYQNPHDPGNSPPSQVSGPSGERQTDRGEPSFVAPGFH
ncbi:MAG: RHS repeat-associated core domain-containing protein [Verrucomicrobia bacterium]|nr:RHS repeat-associated core domain-containing protein [Verrucomicrobiota bacterium]